MKTNVNQTPVPPTVSIVIPVRNEVTSIAATLDACLNQNYQGVIEIVVADARSSDGTRELVSRYANEHGVVLVDNPSHVTPAGLNRAIDASKGSVIVRCDGHSLLPPSYVADAVKILHKTGAGNVGGIQRAAGTSPMQRGIAAAMTNPLGVGDAKFHRGGAPGPVDTVYLGVFPRTVLERLDGYDEALIRNQDYELNVRIRDAGYAVWFDPRLEVAYTPRQSLRALWRQYWDYGTWKRHVIAKHPSSWKLRQAAPPALVIGLAVSALSLFTPLRRAGAAAIVTYGAALSVASVNEATKTRDSAVLIAGPAIGVMHIAWGAGFLCGRRADASAGPSDRLCKWCGL